MDKQTIQLNRKLPVENGGHIVYIFNNSSDYIDNLRAYITDGLALGHEVLIIEELSVYRELCVGLSAQFTEDELRHVHFEENLAFYDIHNDFQAERIVSHFGNVMESLHVKDSMVRTWARVVWGDAGDIDRRLQEFENVADISVQAQGIVSVCVYDGKQISAELLIALLKNHDYLMTDSQFTPSPLYEDSGTRTTFPSLSIQSNIESEIDFYKRKLDFVQVVSHEVRNPLTIISAYANFLRRHEPELSADGLIKIRAMEQYVKIIDHELTHIIETERMLSNELYMKLEIVKPNVIVPEVIELMSTKAALENVEFSCDIDLSESDLMLGNPMGLRLVLSNIVSNAIKFTGEGGSVKFAARQADGKIQFVTKDTGVGMPPRQLKSLFRKYAKLDESRSGQGIGLYIVKSLTDRFGGDIRVESEVNLGTTVVVEFQVQAISAVGGRPGE